MKLIDSDALLKQLGISERFNNADIPAYVIGIIKGMPSAEKKGHCVEDARWFKCSECGYTVNDIFEGGKVLIFERSNMWNFCPNCGARMEADHE